MNKYYIPRWMASEIHKSLEVTPAVILTGIRQVGKSTLLRNEFPDWVYFDIDDPDTQMMAQQDPYSMFTSERVIVDEVQKIPNTLNVTRVLVDRGNLKNVILSGSANLLLMKSVSESLAGRASYVTLFPFTLREASGMRPENILKTLFENGDVGRVEWSIPDLDPEFLLWRGTLPPLLKFTKAEQVNRWMKGYITSYLERDLRGLSAVSSLIDFRKVMSRLALSTGSILNEVEISKDTGVTQSTVHRWINLMEISGIIHRVPGFYRSRTKRLTKREKVYFVDTGIVSSLIGLNDPLDVKKNNFMGLLLETYIGMVLRVYSNLLSPHGALYHWRRNDGLEVDFLVEWKKKLIPFEVKAKTSISFRDFRNLDLLAREQNTARLVIIYMGKELKAFGNKRIAVPWFWF